MREHSIGKRLMESYLRQPYSWFVNKNSSDIEKTILSEVNYVIHNTIYPFMELFSQLMVILAIFSFLIFVDPVLAISSALIFITCYGVVLLISGSFVSQLGTQRLVANRERFKVVSEAFGAFKEVKIGNLEKICVEQFSTPAKIFARSQALELIIRWAPRYAFEAIAFGGVTLLLLLLMMREAGLQQALPILALYTYAGYRMLPAVQKIYGAISLLRFSGPALAALYDEVNNLELEKNSENVILPIKFDKNIFLNNVRFTYSNNKVPTLDGISLNIRANSKIGIVGATGSGKTTFVDLLLSLLTAQNGSLEIDGEIINVANARRWQKNIGYVPQNIYLSDDTIASNIAFGVKNELIDFEAVKKSAAVAQISDFIANELPSGYDTVVGERGVRLSGGQRQRIGIARALYHSPKVLLLDEATSALDGLTEKKVIAAIENVSKDLTLVMVAHRLSTIQDCDQIYFLEHGKIADQGNFQYLLKSNDTFRAMVSGNTQADSK